MSPLQLELPQTLNSIPPKDPICVTVGSEGSSGKSHPEESRKFLLESLESLKFSGKKYFLGSLKFREKGPPWKV